MRPTVRYALFLPALSILLSASIIAVPAVRVGRFIRSAQKSASDTVQIGEFGIPKAALPSFARRAIAHEAYGPVAALNVPAFLVDALISIPKGPNVNSFVSRFGLEVWRVFSYPILALPAWWFVGRGVDGLMRRSPMRLLDLTVSVVFTILFAVLAVGLRFGLTSTERQAQDSLDWFVIGLMTWAVLFALPAISWIMARRQARAALSA